ncbi:MAG: hypothetical protein LBJ87_03225, partial [bacterium]|nr:hypothetical protein [bacterium]
APLASPSTKAGSFLNPGVGPGDGLAFAAVGRAIGVAGVRCVGAALGVVAAGAALAGTGGVWRASQTRHAAIRKAATTAISAATSHRVGPVSQVRRRCMGAMVGTAGTGGKPGC